MDFHQFSNLPVIDGHIHIITHLSLAAAQLQLVQDIHFALINIVATPDQKFGNHNPALIYFKMQFPQTTTKCGAMDYL